MSEAPNQTSPDLIRWTFKTDPLFRADIEDHLDNLGADVLVRDGCKFLVTWDEPDQNLDEVIEAIWALNFEPFDVTQEEFSRQNLHILQHHDEDESTREAA